MVAYPSTRPRHGHTAAAWPRTRDKRRQVQEAIAALSQAEDITPEQVRTHDAVRLLVSDLLTMQDPLSGELRDPGWAAGARQVINLMGGRRFPITLPRALARHAGTIKARLEAPCPTWAFVVERVTRIEFALSDWETNRSGPLTALTWKSDAPRVPVIDPATPRLMAH